PSATPLPTNQVQLLWRFALSCQADADHGDTSRHYGEPPLVPAVPLKAPERLAGLDGYVTKLSEKDSGAPRTQLRQAVYQACRQADIHPRLYACDAPVGSGKTTAIMAHLLRAAYGKNLRRIFVVLPYTNVISQAVEVYRKALVLERENPEEVIAEHHHKADYAAPESRRLTMLWHAPIVVTTAVQFFETLASNMPADLRKLHRLPGSAVFLDEAHATLPAHLWPQAWLWLNELAERWSCQFVLASGSLSRFWELPDFHPESTPEQANPPKLPELVALTPHAYAMDREKTRVAYKTEPKMMDLISLAQWVNKAA
ncbi:MAG: DEAD/DEAH box helicase, partial [Acidobacteriales bacterium]|nr:DEAD/DEAH box helicase [Terriglobales bacterium]